MTLKDNLIKFTLNLERCQGLPHVNKQCSGDLTVLWEQLLCLYIYLTNIANMNILIYSPKLHSARVNVTSAVACRHDLYTSLPLIQPPQLRLGAGTRTALPRLPHGAPAQRPVAAACPWGSLTPTSSASCSKSLAFAICGPVRSTSPNISR